jgi:hypothetical protein
MTSPMSDFGTASIADCMRDMPASRSEDTSGLRTTRTISGAVMAGFLKTVPLGALDVETPEELGADGGGLGVGAAVFPGPTGDADVAMELPDVESGASVRSVGLPHATSDNPIRRAEAEFIRIFDMLVCLCVRWMPMGLGSRARRDAGGLLGHHVLQERIHALGSCLRVGGDARVGAIDQGRLLFEADRRTLHSTFA